MLFEAEMTPHLTAEALEDLDRKQIFAALEDACKRMPGVSRACVNSLYTQGWREGRARLIARIMELEARKCSHGDYRMLGTDDCKNWNDCSGRTEIYVIGEGLCVSCRLSGNGEKE